MARPAATTFADHRPGTAALRRRIGGIEGSPRLTGAARWARALADPPSSRGVAQRELKPATGKFKVTAGLEEGEKTFAGFLEANGIGNLFYPPDRTTLTSLHGTVVEAHTAHRKSKGAGTGQTLKRAYGDLVSQARNASVMPGSQHWNDLLADAVNVIRVEVGAGFFTKAAAAKAVAAVWPAALGAVPDKDAPFTKAVLADAKPEAERPAPKVLPAQAQAVIRHANERYEAWRSGEETNRGGWHGSDQHGPPPPDYETVGSAVLTELQQGLPTGGWRLHDNSLSADQGFSLHRGVFIYHL